MTVQVAYVNQWPGFKEVVYTDGQRVEMTDEQYHALENYLTYT